MISGGSAGLRMMIAFPRVAPPTSTIAWLVVSVNSSMLARVPGPAERDAIEAGERVEVVDERFRAGAVEVLGARQR
jgi:hypothetical protein